MRLYRIIYCGMAGIAWGLALALLLAQWVWLEMRFNAGYFVLFGCAAGVLAGFCRLEIKCGRWFGLASIGAVTAAALAAGGGEPAALAVVPAAIFREGANLSMLPLNAINIMLAAILMLILAMSLWGKE